jgi:ubiquinone/menaquinone biosynthesis C-methylase UbiE
MSGGPGCGHPPAPHRVRAEYERLANAVRSDDSYAWLSRVYDLFELIFPFGGKGNPRRGLLEVIPNEPIQVLDICVGTAASSLAVAAENTRVRIVGIDISDGMLAIAARKIRHRRLANVCVRKMSATEMDFADRTFDVAMVSFALHEFESDQREQVLCEASRVLKPNGLFCVVDFARQDNRLNRVFLAGWARLEPHCFADFLRLDWLSEPDLYGFALERVIEFSFSNLYLLRRTQTMPSVTALPDDESQCITSSDPPRAP